MSSFPTSDVYNFLKNNSTAVLATSYRSLPYASAIYYALDDKMNFYFATKMNTDKYLNLKTNNNVAVVVGFGSKHISVQVRGQATIIKDPKLKNKILNEISSILIKNKNIENWPIKKIENLQAKKKAFNEEIVYKIVPQHMAFINLDDKSFPDSVSNKQHRIIPILNIV